MTEDKNVDSFLAQYSEAVIEDALRLRQVLSANLPEIIEQVDLPARMIAYCYGQRYIDMVCAILPSKKGLKLSFNKGVDLPDPDKLLEGTGKITRYVEIKSAQQIRSAALKKLIRSALAAYKERI